MIKFKINSEKYVVGTVGTPHYRITCEDAKGNIFFTKNGESVMGKYQGGYCDSVTKKGTKIDINGTQVEMLRDTAIDASFTTTATLTAGKEFLAVE